MKYLYFFLFLCLSINSSAQIIDVIDELNKPQDILVVGDDMYIIERIGQKILKIDLNDPENTLTTLLSGIPNMYGLAIRGDELYFSASSTDEIFKIDLTVTNPTPQLVLSGVGTPFSIAFKGDELYICERYYNKIVKINVTDENPTMTDVALNLGKPEGLVFNGDDLYVSGFNNYKIYKIDTSLANPTVTDFVTLGSNKQAQGLAIYNDELYFTQVFRGDISKISLSESNPTPITLIDGLLTGPRALFVYGDDLLISDTFADKIVKVQFGTLGINEISIENLSIEIFPNPAVDFLNIDGLVETTYYSIYSISGQKVSEGSIDSQNSIEVSNLTEGIYYLSLGKLDAVFKFVKG